MNFDVQNVRSVVRSCGVFLAIVIFVVTSTASCRATDDEAVLARIKAAWTERANAVGKVRYHLSGSVTYLPGSLVPSGDPLLSPDDKSAANGLPEREATQPVRVVWTFDFPNSMFRKESHDWSLLLDQRTYRPIVRTDVFNGTELKGLIPREANTGGGHVPGLLDADFEIGSETKVPWFFYAADMPVLYAHGVFQFLPTRLRDGRLSVLPPLKVLLEDATTSDEHVVVLSAKIEKPGSKDASLEHEHRFWVDLSKNAAIVRWEDRFRSGVAKRFTAQWREHGQHWLPESWTFTKFDVMNTETKVALLYHYHVEQVDVEPDVTPADFDVQYGPGMIVRRLEDNARFQVAADGKTLRMVGPPPLSKSKTGTARTTPAANSWWLAVCLIVAGVGLAVTYVRLRSHESH